MTGGRLMRQYDIAVGIGVGCGVSISMRDAGVQYLSLPFDWIGCNDPVRLAEIAADRFKDWMRLEDLEIQGVRIASQSAHFVVINRRTGLLAPHDFTAFAPLKRQYPAFAEKMARRVARLESVLSSARAVLLVNVENPQRPGCLADADLERARGILAAAYPNAVIDLVCFQHEDGVRGLAEHRVSDRIIRVGCRLQQVMHGLVSHTYEHEPIISWLRANVRVMDPRTADETRAFAELKQRQHEDRFGVGGPFARLIARLQFRTYKKLQKALERKGVIPGERTMSL